MLFSKLFMVKFHLHVCPRNDTYICKSSKKEYLSTALKTVRKYTQIDAITVRNTSEGRELAYVEAPWNSIYLGETYKGIPQLPDLPTGLKWEGVPEVISGDIGE